RLDASAREDLRKNTGVERIAVVNQLARGSQEPVDAAGQIAGHLFHPPPARLRVDPGNGHPTGLQLDYEEDKVPPRPASVSTSTVKRSQAVSPSQCACKNTFHGVRRARSGAGSIPWSCRIRFTVFRARS